MKKLAMLLPVIVMMINLANSQAIGKSAIGNAMTTKSQALTVTKKGQALAVSRYLSIPKPKVFRSNPLRKSLIIGGSDPSQTIDDEDYIFARNRNRIEIKKFKVDDEELSEHIRWRLFLARQLALMKYREIMAKSIA